MDKSITKSIEINTPASKVWNALINPNLISQYLPGVEAITDWKPGSEVKYVHSEGDKKVIDKGTILDAVPPHLLRHTYWTPYSGLDDRPENYTIISFSLKETDNKTVLSVEQTNFRNDEWWRNSLTGWDDVLTTIKRIIESIPAN